MHPTRFGVLLVSLALLGACATLHSKPSNPIDALNEEALVDYQKGRAKIARQKLMRSLSLAKDGGPAAKTSAARSRLYLGVVYAGALKQPGKAVEQMAKALEEDPSLQLPAGVEKNVRVKRAYVRAEAKANRARTAAALQLDKEKPAGNTVVAANDAANEVEPSVRGGKGRNKRGKDKRGARKAAVAAVAAPPPPPAETAPPPAEEADVPGALPEMVFCPLPDEVPPGEAVKIWCAVDPSVKARALVVQVRPAGQTEFTALPATRTGKGWYTATIDGAQVKGSMLQYFVEARGSGGGGMPLAASGDFDSPELLLIRDGAPVAPALLTNAHLEALEEDEAPASAAAAAAVPEGEDHEDPFARDQPAAEPSTPSRFALSDFWVGLQAGTGYGWHSGRAFELRTNLDADGGFAPASSLTLLPEIGYRFSPTINFSVQTRHQFIFHEGTAPGDGKPAVGAHSLILKGSYLLLERDALTVAGTGSLGFGEGYRLVYGTDAAAGRTGTDTVRGGQMLLGPGVLAAYLLTGTLSATAEVRLLFAFPDVAALAEFSAGLRYGL